VLWYHVPFTTFSLLSFRFHTFCSGAMTKQHHFFWYPVSFTSDSCEVQTTPFLLIPCTFHTILSGIMYLSHNSHCYHVPFAKLSLVLYTYQTSLTATSHLSSHSQLYHFFQCDVPFTPLTPVTCIMYCSHNYLLYPVTFTLY
jgi:hypothetical protein